jgi:predicted transcriptional regulator
MGPAMAMMGETMAASMERAMQEVAAAVEAGQFATLEEVSKAIVGKMADAIGGLGGGGGRGRGF